MRCAQAGVRQGGRGEKDGMSLWADCFGATRRFVVQSPRRAPMPLNPARHPRSFAPSPASEEQGMGNR